MNDKQRVGNDVNGKGDEGGSAEASAKWPKEKTGCRADIATGTEMWGLAGHASSNRNCETRR